MWREKPGSQKKKKNYNDYLGRKGGTESVQPRQKKKKRDKSGLRGGLEGIEYRGQGLERSKDPPLRG